jgi:hypothetical protein
MEKFAIKRLTSSDLTFFEWHFRNLNAGNQKAINLNADVFIDELYPALPELAIKKAGRLPIDLFIYGPNGAPELNLQRKIIKLGAYKNWRLNGEFIYNPLEQPQRFNVLASDDFAIFKFQGDVEPETLHIAFIASKAELDKELHAVLDGACPKMVSVSEGQLVEFLKRSNIFENHPVSDLAIGLDLEDAALGGSQGRNRLLRRRIVRSMGKLELVRARQLADEIGQIGEALVASYLQQMQNNKEISDVTWTSQDNAIAPFDFQFSTSSSNIVRIDVKATSGDFDRPLHISFAELEMMADPGTEYRIFRVFNVNPERGSLKISDPLNNFAVSVLSSLSSVPQGVSIDGLSVDPLSLRFSGGDISLTDAP